MLKSMPKRSIKKPIFLNCFSRGGSNIFWNLFLSHPQACSPIHETLAIFRADWRRPAFAGLCFAVLSGQLRFFDQWKLEERQPLNRLAARFLDSTLQRRKTDTLSDLEMRYKNECEVYSADEVEACRLVAKHNNGLAYLTGPLLDVYPDASFFALVRHPVALYESHLRRGIAKSPGQFVSFFNTVARKVIEDQDKYPRYHLVRFEDALDDPVGTAKRLQTLAGFEPALCPKLRFKAKRHFRSNGTYGSELEEGRHYWFAPDEVREFFEPSVNRIQEEQLDRNEARTVFDATENVRHILGYE